MAGVKSMLARLRALEAARSPVLSPFEEEFGSLDGFEAHCRAGIDQGLYDGADMLVVMLSVRRWHRELAA